MGTVIPFPTRSAAANVVVLSPAVEHEDETWFDHAACVDYDPNLWFRGDLQLAKAVCAECPVRRDCLEHAMAQGEKFGVWGGLDERERRRLRRRRRAG